MEFEPNADSLKTKIEDFVSNRTSTSDRYMTVLEKQIDKLESENADLKDRFLERMFWMGTVIGVLFLVIVASLEIPSVVLFFLCILGLVVFFCFAKKCQVDEIEYGFLKVKELAHSKGLWPKID